MILTILLLFAVGLAALWVGYRHMVRLEHLNRRLVIRLLLASFLLLTLMSVAHWIGLVSQSLAARVTMGLYSAAAGFFFGYGIRLIRLHVSSGALLYMNRSFWVDVAPNLIAIALFVYGIYRTGVLSGGPFTGIGITSGLSLIGFGFFGWTVRIVPEFRTRGVLLLDQVVPWKRIVSFEWVDEEAIRIDYMTTADTISEFTTFIPADETREVDLLLEEKLRDHGDERRQMMQGTEEQQVS